MTVRAPRVSLGEVDFVLLPAGNALPEHYVIESEATEARITVRVFPPVPEMVPPSWIVMHDEGFYVFSGETKALDFALMITNRVRIRLVRKV